MQSMLASSLFLSCPLASGLCFFAFVCSVMMHVHAWRLRPLGLGPYVFLRRSLADSIAPPVPALFALSLVLLLFPMADAAVPAAPCQQRRKEARAQAQDDSRRVRQRLDEMETRIENLEGRFRGHDLRLQYLEAPLKLRKFKARVEFWAAKDNGFQAPRSAFSAALLQELRKAGGATIQNLLEEAEPIMAQLDSWVIIGIVRAGGSTQDRDGVIVPDALLRLHPSWELGVPAGLPSEQYRSPLG